MVPQCLAISEVLRVVCGSLGRNDLLSVALTCRSFLEPALDELWHEISAFKPLIACLPSELLEIKVTKFSVILAIGVVHLRPSNGSDGELKPAHLSRYLGFYARRIRVVNYPFTPFTSDTVVTLLSPELLRVLELLTQLQPGAFSPLIHELHWVPDSWEMAQYAFPAYTLFLNATIRNLRIGIHSNVPTHVASLRCILASLPALKTLEVSDRKLPSPDSEDIPFIHECGFLTTSSWDHLETLTVASLPATAIPHLSSLPNLITLRLNEPIVPLLGSSSVEEEQYAPDASGFQALRILEIDSEPMDIIGFLQRLHPTNRIHTLKLTTYHFTNDTIMEYASRTQALLNVIHFHLNPDTLQDLIVYEASEDAIEEELLDLGARALDITPLLKFHNLTSLEVFLDDGVWVSPAQLRAIPTALPRIETLWLHNNSPNHHSLIDHTHIVEIASRCPSLTSLNLPFDASRILGPGEPVLIPGLGENRGAGVTRPPSLKTLGVCLSPIKSPSCVIYFLFTYFPDLNYLRCDMNRGLVKNLNTQRWELVQQAVENRAKEIRHESNL